MHDLVINGGLIIDGTGAPAQAGDIAIDHGVNSQVGGKAGPARRTLDAQGAMVTPGWIDIHTGLGPFGHGEKIFAGANDPAELARCRAWYGADVMSYYEGKSASTEVQGSMVMCIYAECPGIEVTGMGLEYGTVPFEAVLDAIRGDSWQALHPEASAEKRAAIKRAILDAFYSDTDEWKGRVLGQARTAVLQAVTALSAA